MSDVDSNQGAPEVPQRAGDQLVPDLPIQMKYVGMNSIKVDEFMGLLTKCNVHTRGALAIFAGQCETLVMMMYDTSDPLGALEARGFYASLQVRCAYSVRPPLCACTNKNPLVSAPSVAQDVANLPAANLPAKLPAKNTVGPSSSASVVRMQLSDVTPTLKRFTVCYI